MKGHSKRILSLVFALLMLFQQVMFAAQTVDLFNPELGAKTVDLIPGEDDTNTVDLLTPSDEDSTKTVDLLNPEQPSATIEQQKPIIEKNENKTVDTITPRGDDIVPAEGKKSTTTIVVGGDEIEEGETNEDSEITPAEIILPEENQKEEEKKDATFEDEEHHENAGVLPWSTNLVKPWSIYREPKKVYRPGEDLDLTELLVEIKTGRSGSLYNIEDLINDEFTTITRTRKSDGQKVRLDDKIYENETMTIHMDGCQDLTIDLTVDENLKDEEKALEAFQQNLIREEFRDGLDFSLYLIKKGEKENPVVAYSLDPHKLTPIGNGVDKKLKDGPLFNLKDINTWDRYDIETIGKVKAILERSAELKNTENVRKKLITQLAIWNVTSNIIPKEIDATVSEPTEIAPELKPADETKENPDEDKKDEPIEITDPTTPEEETKSIVKDDEKAEDKKDETVEIKTEEKVEEKTETEENKESEKIEEKTPVESTVHKIVFNTEEIDVPYDEVELSDEEYELYKELTSLEAVELKNEDENLKIYEPIVIEETENQYADLVTIGESDIDSIERVATEVTFDAVEYSFQNLYHALETSSMLGFGQPRDFNVLLKATMKASRKIVKGDKFEVEILSKTLPILNGEEGRANDIQIDGKVVATAEYIAEEHKIVYTFVEDLDTDKVEIEQEFKQIKEEKAALLNMLEVSGNLVQGAVLGAEGTEDSEENSEELEISPEDDNAAIKLVLGNTPVQYNEHSFETKKFRLKTTMTAKAAPVWQIPKDWTFDVNIGPYLKPDPNYPLKNLYDPDDPSVVIAKPTYNPNTHTITYTYAKSISSTKTLDIDQYLAFDTKAIDDREEIEINIVVAPKDNKVQRIPTIKVRKDDPRSEIISGNIEEKRDFSEVSYPYMISYTSRQTVNGSIATWDIEVDTEPLKRDDLDYNKIALALYIPQNQGLSNSKIYIGETEYDFDASSGIDLFSKSIPKNEIPDSLKIHVEADVLTERDSYSLGIRITPDKGYIENLRKNVQAKLNSLTPAFPPLVTIFKYLKDPNNSRQFDNGFNLLDTRISATGVPENGSERAEGYNDPLRNFYSYRIDNKKIGFKLSETIDLKNIKSSIGSDVYDQAKIIFKNVSRHDKAKPSVNIYIPVNDSQSANFGKYERFELGNIDKNAFNGKIKNLKERIIPGTIIEYDFNGEQSNQNNDFSMKMTLDERKVFIDNLYEYQKTSGNVEAKFINVGTKKEQYRVGKYVFQNIFKTGDYRGPVLFKVLENGEDGFCINPDVPNPTNTGNHHTKIVFGNTPTDEELRALHDAFNMKKANPPFNAEDTKTKLNKFKKIFYCYDRYIRENNLDPINDEEVKYIVRDAKQAAIFDVVNGSGREFLEKGYPSEPGRAGYTSGKKTIAFYEKLNRYIDAYPDLTEEQLKSVTITLYPINGGNFQNIISGRVKNPVYIEKRNQNGDALIGAKFQITRKFSRRIVAEWTSNGGPQELYLDPGEYTLKEVEAPKGYDKIDDVDFTVEEKITEKNIRVSRLDGASDKYFDSTEIYKDIVISINSDVQDVNQTNKYMFTVINKKHGFKIKKVDAGDENNLLRNAEFTLYDKNNKEEKVLTDAKGIAEFTGLEPGTYILKETKAPDGYNIIDKPVYVNIPEEGKITFSNFQDKIKLDSTIFTYIKEDDITKKAAVFDGIKDRVEELNIREHSDYPDFMNLKTNLISADQNTVKTRIFLNPSTDSKNGIGPNRNTILTLSKNNANHVDYKVYKIEQDKKASITEELLNNNTLVKSGSINSNSTATDIDFKTYGTYATPDSTDEKRWQGDAYIVDITSYYIGKNDLSDETREIDYNWKYINTSGAMETFMEGKVGATVKFKEGDVVVKEGDAVLEVKNSKGPKVTIVKVDENVNADGSRKVLPGAKFGLFDKDGKLIKKEDGTDYEVLTNIEGKATFEDLEAGKIYIIKELDAPVGYEKTDKIWKIVVGNDNKVNVTEKETYLEPSIENPKNTINYQDDYGNPALKIASSIQDNKDGTFKGILNITSLYERNENIINSMVFELDNEHFKYKYNGSNSSYPVDKINWDTGYPVYKSNGVNVFTFEIIPNKDIVAGQYSPITNVLINGHSTDINLPKLTLTTKERVTDKSLDNKDNEFSFQVDNKYKGFEVEFKKIDAKSIGKPELVYLKDAEFKIEIKDGEKFRPLNEGEKKLTNETCTSDANGTISFKGLKPGTYRLIETKAPDHYHKPDGAVVVFYIREPDGKAFIIESDGRLVELNAESNKINNVPKGTESFTVNKQGDGNNPLAGVEFTLYSIDGTKLESGITDADGKVVFKELEFGTYILKETKTVDGYILDSTPKIINIGKDFEVPTNVQGANDVSKAFVLDELDENNKKVELRASEIRDDRKEVVYPNSSESIFAELHYKIDPTVKINPGDTFTMTFNDSVDLDGIDKTPDKEFDIYGPFGKFAKAKVIGDYPNRREIKYTVTNYVDQNSIDSIYMLYPLYINRFKFKTDKSVNVTATLGPKTYTDDIKVVFSNIFDLENPDKNLMAYMRELHVDTKKFKSVVYVNPKARERYNKRIFFNSNQNYNIDSVKIYKVKDKTKAFPHSFGIDFGKFSESGLEYYGEVTGNKNDFIIKDTETLTERDKFRYGSNAMYVLEVDGTVNTTKLTDFKLSYNYYEYYQHDDGYEKTYFDWSVFRNVTVWVSDWKQYYNSSYRETFGQFYFPNATIEGIRQIKLKNYKNKIEFTKVDDSIAGSEVNIKPQGSTEGANGAITVSNPVFSSKGNPLQGAEFILKKDGVELPDTKKTSDKYGKFSWEGLAPGKYEVIEIVTPKGYVKPTESVSSFEVNEKGEIVNLKNDNTTIVNEKIKPDIEFKKIDGKENTPLKDAEFTLYKAKVENGSLVIDGNSLKFEVVNREVKESGNKVVKPYTATSDKNGLFKFEKLEDGIYAVKETKAPKDYALLLKYSFFFKVEGGKIYRVNELGKYIDSEKKVVEDKDKDKSSLIVDITIEKPINIVTEIENFKTEYPSTGGVGTLPFVFIGMMIMMAGAYMFIRRRDALYE